MHILKTNYKVIKLNIVYINYARLKIRRYCLYKAFVIKSEIMEVK